MGWHAANSTFTPMKTSLLLVLLLASASALKANPELATVIGREYGTAISEGILLLKSTASATDPEQWAVYARDPFREGALVRVKLTKDERGWVPATDGAGSKLLQRVPPQIIAFNRVKYRSADALKVAQETAMVAKTNFVTAEYQLVANTATGAPEWGLALKDPNGVEVGFVVVSTETGTVLHQQWSNDPAKPAATTPDTKGERAAVEVKDAARRAWEWTGDAGLEVGHFFRKLFSRD